MDKKKSSFTNLSTNYDRQKRSLKAARNARSKNVTDEIMEDRKKRLKEFKEW